ncbi:hypothetical protein [Streptomyces niveus]|uniref:hypothetical protein n=1 Tax=Streptomyces niveus TaxID=193462 RepID=UPI000A88E5B3
MDRMPAAHETGDDEWEGVPRVDLTAPSLLTRAVLPHMLLVDGWSAPGHRLRATSSNSTGHVGRAPTGPCGLP